MSLSQEILNHHQQALIHIKKDTNLSEESRIIYERIFEIEDDLYKTKGMSYIFNNRPDMDESMIEYSSNIHHPLEIWVLKTDDENSDNEKKGKRLVITYKSQLVKYRKYVHIMSSVMQSLHYNIAQMYIDAFHHDDVYILDFFSHKNTKSEWDFRIQPNGTGAIFNTLKERIKQNGVITYDMLTDQFKSECLKILNRLDKHNNIIYSLNLFRNNKNIPGHANVVIFEKDEDAINMYHYEPHGYGNSDDNIRYDYGTIHILNMIQVGLISSGVHKPFKVRVTNLNVSCKTGLQVYSEDEEGYCIYFSLLIVYYIFQFMSIHDKKVKLHEFIPRVTKYYKHDRSEEYTYMFIVSFAWWLMTTLINKLLTQEKKDQIILNTIERLELRRKKHPEDFKEETVQMSPEDWEIAVQKLGPDYFRIEEISTNAKSNIDDSYLLDTFDYYSEQQAEQKKLTKEQEEKIFSKRIGEKCEYSYQCMTDRCDWNTKTCIPADFYKEQEKTERLLSKKDRRKLYKQEIKEKPDRYTPY